MGSGVLAGLEVAAIYQPEEEHLDIFVTGTSLLRLALTVYVFLVFLSVGSLGHRGGVLNVNRSSPISLQRGYAHPYSPEVATSLINSTY